ncbi:MULTISPECIES: hypothetical protein [unclassified Virgibacillus]|uniref:hypothetical protein n=1 Tax=unclassified Virgibacillus TaxID=2620237 RepID=UPI00090A665B|nr:MULTISPECIES: hypothetical protein [unclassified Virgibacillus]API93114.1 hypothetical protein BKP57_15635 [Virgibacillus sp. 6R]MBS7428850.1 hypothetical protein [Virgibacillus sp. 19R1-5]
MIMRSIGTERFSSINPHTTYKKASTETSKADKIGSEKKNTSSLPDRVVNKIKEMAQDGAAKSVYMGKDYISFINSYKKQHVSPDRSKLIRLLTPTLLTAKYTNGLPFFFRLIGLPFTGKMCVGATGSSMFIYDENGDEVLSYSTESGWKEGQTRAEAQFYGETTAIYYKAYKAAREEMKANSTQNYDMGASSTFNARA